MEVLAVMAYQRLSTTCVIINTYFKILKAIIFIFDIKIGMKTLAFTFSSNGLYYVILTGTKAQPIFHSKGKIILPANHTVPQTVAWFENQLELLLNTNQPDVVSYKLTINNVTNNMVQNCYYGQSILNLLCHKKVIDISHTSPSAIVASKFGLPKNSDLHLYIDQVIGAHPPYWDARMRDTALIALNLLA